MFVQQAIYRASRRIVKSLKIGKQNIQKLDIMTTANGMRPTYWGMPHKDVRSFSIFSDRYRLYTEFSEDHQTAVAFSTVLSPASDVVNLNPQPAKQINNRLLNFSSASFFKVLQCCSKVVNMLSEYQTAWIQMRRRVTRRLSQIQAVCIRNYSCVLGGLWVNGTVIC